MRHCSIADASDGAAMRTSAQRGGLAGQAELASVLGISQLAVSKALKEESNLSAALAGFRGGTGRDHRALRARRDHL